MLFFEGSALFLGEAAGETVLRFLDGNCFELGQGFFVAFLGKGPDFFTLLLGRVLFGDNF